MNKDTGEAGKHADPKYCKTYKSYSNAEKAGSKMIERLRSMQPNNTQARFVVSVNEGDGRFYPLFIGRDCNSVIFNGHIWLG